MKLHEALVPVAYYHFIIMLVVYMFGVFAPNVFTRYWLMPNLLVLFTYVLIISFSRFNDKRYATLFRKHPQYYLQ